MVSNRKKLSCSCLTRESVFDRDIGIMFKYYFSDITIKSPVSALTAEPETLWFYMHLCLCPPMQVVDI